MSKLNKTYIVLRDQFNRDDIFYECESFDAVYEVAVRGLRVIWDDKLTPVNLSKQTAFIEMAHNGYTLLRLHGTDKIIHISENVIEKDGF